MLGNVFSAHSFMLEHVASPYKPVSFPRLRAICAPYILLFRFESNLQVLNQIFHEHSLRRSLTLLGTFCGLGESDPAFALLTALLKPQFERVGVDSFLP